MFLATLRAVWHENGGWSAGFWEMDLQKGMMISYNSGL